MEKRVHEVVVKRRVRRWGWGGVRVWVLLWLKSGEFMTERSSAHIVLMAPPNSVSITEVLRTPVVCMTCGSVGTPRCWKPSTQGAASGLPVVWQQDQTLAQSRMPSASAAAGPFCNEQSSSQILTAHRATW